MKIVLITGATGFFGQTIFSALKDLKHQIIRTARNDGDIRTNLLDPIAQKSLLNKTNPDICIHLAWYVPPGEFWNSPMNMGWLDSSINLFREFCANGGKTFIGAGTIAEYDWSSGHINSTTPLAPPTLYGQCKKKLLDEIHSIRDKEYPNVKIIWPRIGYFFGEGEPPQKLMSRLVSSIQNKTPLTLLARNASRPYAHVKYLGQCYADMLDLKKDAVFNLSAKNQPTFESIVNAVSQTLGISPDNITYGRQEDIRNEPLSLKIDTAVLKNCLGYNIADSFFDDLVTFVKKTAKI